MKLILLFVSALLLLFVHSSEIPVDESGLPDPEVINHERPTLRGKVRVQIFSIFVKKVQNFSKNAQIITLKS